VAYKMALTNTQTPTGIILSRQDVKALPSKGTKSRIEDAKDAEKGAYIVYEDDGYPDLILLGNGSEVRLLYESMLLLKEKMEIKCRIISMISIGLFENQSELYKKTIFSNKTPVFALTTGLKSVFEKYVGENGKVFGLDHFGFSAPMEVLDKEFGFTPENIMHEISKML
jgi:transketolase